MAALTLTNVFIYSKYAIDGNVTTKDTLITIFGDVWQINLSQCSVLAFSILDFRKCNIVKTYIITYLSVCPPLSYLHFQENAINPYASFHLSRVKMEKREPKVVSVFKAETGRRPRREGASAKQPSSAQRDVTKEKRLRG